MSDVDISIRVIDKDILASLKRIERGFNSMRTTATRTTTSTSQGFDKMTSSVRKFESSIVLLTRSFQLLAGGAALNLFRGFVDQVESANNAIRSISKTQSQFAALQQEAINTANATGTAYRETATSIVRVYRSIEDMGYSAQNAIDIVANLNKTLLISGATGSEAVSTLIQFTQALQSGVLQGDELRSLRENAPLIFKAIAKSAGVATSELKKMGSQGKLTTELIANAILDPNFTKGLDELRARMDRTFVQSLQVASNNFAIFVEELNRSSGVLKAVGDLMVKLSQSLAVLTDFKATAAFIALTAAMVAYRNTALVVALTTRGLAGVFALLYGAVGRATVAMLLFVRSNPVLLAISLAVAGIAYAYDRITGAAKAAKERVEEFQQAAALETVPLNDFLSEKQLDALIKAKAALAANAAAVEALTKKSEALRAKEEQIRNLREDAGNLLRLELQNRANAALNNAKDIEATNSGLQKTVNLMMQVVALAKQAIAIGSAVGSAQKVVQGLAEQLKAARGLKQTDQERIQAAQDLIKEQEKIAVNTARERGDNQAAIDLIRQNFLKLSDDAEIYTKALIAAEKANKDFGKSAKVTQEKKGPDLSGLFADYKTDIDNATAALANLKAQLALLQQNAPEVDISALQTRLDLETKIADLKNKYAKTGDGGEQLAQLEKDLAVVNDKIEKAGIAYDAQKAAVERLNAARQEGIILAAQLAAAEAGASTAEIEAIRTRIEAQNELNGAIQGTIDAVITEEANNTKTADALEKKISLMDTLRAKADEFATSIGTAFGEVIVGAKSASEALKALLLDVIKLIVKFLALKAIQSLTGVSPTGSSASIPNIMPQGIGPVGFSPSGAIRVYNYGNAPGGVKATRQSDGSVEIIIGQITSAIQRGGNPLDATLRRTYGIGRVGV